MAKIVKIKFLVLDVDGVLTDGGMYYSESGDEFKKFNTKDGLGIKRVVAAGIPVGFISSGKNKIIINNRAALLGVEYVYAGFDEKLPILNSWREKLSLTWKDIAYIGDDMNDSGIMKKVGVPACPADAVQEIKKISKVILKKKGGEGCVREFIEKFIIPIS